MIEMPEPIAYQGRRYSTDADDPGWGTWITLSVDEVDHWKNLIAAGYKREVRELIATDQLRTYGDQRAAEAREQMREECVKLFNEISKAAWAKWLVECDPHQRGVSMGANACEKVIKELK